MSLLLAVLALGAGVAEAKTVRVSAVGPRFDLDWVDSRADFATKLDSMVFTIPRTGSDLVTLPEDIGLMAAFSGMRGVPARTLTAETGGLTGAIGSLAGTYGPQLSYYAGRYPALADRGVPTRALALALTDTFGRVAVETFSELADRYDVWLEAGVNMAREWRVVCRSQAAYVPAPSRPACDAEDPGLVATLGDPDEPARDYAYEATTDEPVNMALLFDPDGRLHTKQVKAYLTPVELPGQLDLVPGDPAGLEAVDTPVGKLGFVTSKDAWMPDVTGRLDDAGVEILVQPEFFVGDTIRTTGPWAADTLKASGYSDLLRHPSLKAMVLPELTGDVYDFSADAQSHIAVRGGPAGALVGQDPAPGLSVVQPWLAPDPLDRNLNDRRLMLGLAGEAAIGTGTQQEGVLYADVEVGETPARDPVARRRDRPLAPSSAVQSNVAVASRGRTVYAAWEQAGTVRTVVSRTQGRRWGRVRTRGKGRSPAVAVGRGGTLWLTYERADGKVIAAENAGRGRPLAPGGGRQARPAIVALARGEGYAVFIDDRSGAFGVYGGQVGDVPERLDQGRPVALAEQLDNSWAPHVATREKKVLVTWADFRAYKWDVYSRLSSDRGETFAPQVRLNDSPDDVEALDDSPQAGFLRGDPYLVWTDFRKRPTPLVNPLYGIHGAQPGHENAVLDGDGARPLSAFAPALAQLPPGRLVVAWQSHRGDTADIHLREIGGAVRRVDDAGERAFNSWRPAVTRLGRRRVLVLWEDDRDGPRNIFRRTLVLPSAPSP